jgi:hypothetical protein
LVRKDQVGLEQLAGGPTIDTYLSKGIEKSLNNNGLWRFFEIGFATLLLPGRIFLEPSFTRASTLLHSRTIKVSSLSGLQPATTKLANRTTEGRQLTPTANIIITSHTGLSRLQQKAKISSFGI